MLTDPSQHVEAHKDLITSHSKHYTPALPASGGLAERTAQCDWEYPLYAAWMLNVLEHAIVIQNP